jgi:hypothetical protein
MPKKYTHIIMQAGKELKKLQKARDAQKKKVEKSYKKYNKKHVAGSRRTPVYEKKYETNYNKLKEINKKLNNNASKTLMKEKGLLGKNKALSLLNEIERKGKNIPNIPQNIKNIITNQLKSRPKINVTRELVSNFKNYPFHIQKKIVDLLYNTNVPVKNIMNYETLEYIMNRIDSNTNRMMYKPVKHSIKMKQFMNEYKKYYNSGKTYKQFINITYKLNSAFN